MRQIGQLLLWAGFLGAAFCSVLRLPPPAAGASETVQNEEVVASEWGTIPWLGYGASMLFGVAGVALLRNARKQDHHDDVKTEAEFSVLQESLETVSAVVQELCNQPDLHPAEVLRTIDDQCAEPLSDFADSRQSLVKRFGLNTYAEIMTEFASAERFLNRAWSASADGYIDEVRSCVERANEHLTAAKRLLGDAQAIG